MLNDALSGKYDEVHWGHALNTVTAGEVDGSTRPDVISVNFATKSANITEIISNTQLAGGIGEARFWDSINRTLDAFYRSNWSVTLTIVYPKQSQ